ncbi:MAG: hypothetical protein ACO3A2_05400 [Bdellovibrionia bacterium]
MWIAKPIDRLSEEEKLSWEAIPQKPLAQSLAWASAMKSLGTPSFLIFNPEEKVGGIVFASHLRSGLGSKVQLECVNGPLLHWDDSSVVSRQLATFALACSKLNPQFARLTLRPRWEKGQIQKRMSHLPVALTQSTLSSTLVVKLQGCQKTQWNQLSPRLRRTLRTTWKEPLRTTWQELTPTLLRPFTEALREFSARRQFTVPPDAWFESLTLTPRVSDQHSPRFWMVTAQRTSLHLPSTESQAQLLVASQGTTAHYLFGFTQKAHAQKSSTSLSAVAHWEALTQCSKLGLENYDLNGYMTDPKTDHPYFGVAQFKKQFAGAVVEYEVPEFIIE